MNWSDRLERAKKRHDQKLKPFFTPEDVKLSQLWITDPISELTGVPLRDNTLAKGPLDIYLILDGIFFTKGVEDDDLGLAENCYKSTQARAKKLLDISR